MSEGAKMAEETYHYSKRTPANRDLRASDADRTAVGDILRREHVAGRLDADEYAERYGRCLEAKTYAQLDDLIVDLPDAAEPAFRPGPAPVAGPAWQGGSWRSGRRRVWRVPVIAWVALVAVLLALGAGPGAWIAVPLVLFFVVRPLMWRSAWRSGWRGPGWCGRGGCGPGTSGTWM
jgi:Domain of unknown function (DUF1707)